MRAGDQLVCRLVEPDVPVDANTECEQSNSTGTRNRLFVAIALGVEIRSETVETVSPLRIEIDTREQMFGHEPTKASGVRDVETDELVEQKRRGSGEVETSGLVQTTEI